MERLLLPVASNVVYSSRRNVCRRDERVTTMAIVFCFARLVSFVV